MKINPAKAPSLEHSVAAEIRNTLRQIITFVHDIETGRFTDKENDMRNIAQSLRAVIKKLLQLLQSLLQEAALQSGFDRSAFASEPTETVSLAA